jgi:hypothetical protein
MEGLKHMNVKKIIWALQVSLGLHLRALLVKEASFEIETSLKTIKIIQMMDNLSMNYVHGYKNGIKCRIIG